MIVLVALGSMSWAEQEVNPGVSEQILRGVIDDPDSFQKHPHRAIRIDKNNPPPKKPINFKGGYVSGWVDQQDHFPHYLNQLGSAMDSMMIQSNLYVSAAANANVPGYKKAQLNRINIDGEVKSVVHYTWEHTQPVMSERKLDFMIYDVKSFFTVRMLNGSLAYTKDGRFRRLANGRLVTVVNDYDVLDMDGNPIYIPYEDIFVNRNGEIYYDTQFISKFDITRFDSLDGLFGHNNSLFYIANPEWTREIEPKEGVVVQGYLEPSDVEIMRMPIELQRNHMEFTADATKIVLDAQRKLVDATGPE